ncbi:hypothetical protein [Dyadobacter crusticola]|uniref:hypothetical protein n=1 Tax=Dyadobacter crusticola TaxID=292407 RepID=UPI0004E0D801|nr:hypothetical protein [Dyadobacter crusticola]
MKIRRPIKIQIDKLTNSIEEPDSGKCHETLVLPLSVADLKTFKKSSWLFDWREEHSHRERCVFKLVLLEQPNTIQGLVSLQDKGDHIYMHLIESSKANRGPSKQFVGIPGNLIAFGCKTSFEKGYEGYLSFESKTKLVTHYKNILGAEVLFGNVMIINSFAAKNLVDRYFQKKG